MAELEVKLDEAIDRLNAGGGAEPEADGGLGELLELARALRALPAEEWPDSDVPRRLAGRLADELAPHGRPSHVRRAPRLRGRLPLRLGLAAAAALAIAVAAVVVLDHSPSVGAATLAREALAASSGRSLGPVRFTQVIVNVVPAGTFEPAPPPPRVVERVLYAAHDRWRVQATITEPNGEGTTTVLSVRNGDTIVAVRSSPDEGKTESRRPAGADSGLPGASAYGAQIDPLTLLAQTQGRCARRLSPVQDGPAVAGRPTQLLRIGATPCPSADTSELNGPATFVVDRETHLVLEAQVHDSSGRLTQRVETRTLTTGAAISAGAFRLPKPLPKPPAARAGQTAFVKLLPSYLPGGLYAGPLETVQTQAATGKILAFTVTYRDAGGRARLQLYEAAASTPSVRFRGRRVVIRPGLTGTYSSSNGLRILWWIEHGTYVSLQQGGSSAGVPLTGTFPLRTLVRIAASTA